MTEITDTLPSKASELIRLALRDLRAVESEPDKFIVDMYEWHRPVSLNGDGPCVVCLAGSVLAKSLSVESGEYVGANLDGSMFVLRDLRSHRKDFIEPGVAKKLLALDYFRSDKLFNAMSLLLSNEEMKDVGELFDDHEQSIPDYEDDRELFHTRMGALADWLEDLGY